MEYFSNDDNASDSIADEDKGKGRSGEGEDIVTRVGGRLGEGQEEELLWSKAVASERDAGGCVRRRGGRGGSGASLTGLCSVTGVRVELIPAWCLQFWQLLVWCVPYPRIFT